MSERTLGADFVRGIWRENPVLVQTLGMCPTLAVTNSVENAIAMGAATFFVLVASCVFASLLRRFIPNEVRISTYVLIIATFTTIADYLLAALVPDVHKALGAFIALIVVNCIILARQEAFASRNTVLRATLDAVGSGFGFIVALLIMGSIREVVGNGTWLNLPLFGASYQPWVIMKLPPGGFLTLGSVLLVLGWLRQRKVRRQAAPRGGDDGEAVVARRVA